MYAMDEDDADIDPMLLPRFNTMHSLVLQQVSFEDKKKAEESYVKLLAIYREIAASDLSYLDKQQAYQRLKAVHEKLFTPQEEGKWTTLMYPIALALIVLLVLFFTKPQVSGITALVVGQGSDAPVWDSEITTMSISGTAQIPLEDYFSDPNGDQLSYDATHPENLYVAVSGSTVTIVPQTGVKGVRYITFSASDGEYITKQVIKLTII